MTHLDADSEDRREFLKSCGKFAAVTPPALTLLLSTSLASGAIAGSAGHPVYAEAGGPRGNNGVGNGGDGSPNGKPDLGSLGCVKRTGARCGVGAGAATAELSRSGGAFARMERLISRSSSFLPARSCAFSHRGCLPRPDKFRMGSSGSDTSAAPAGRGGAHVPLFGSRQSHLSCEAVLLSLAFPRIILRFRTVVTSS